MSTARACFRLPCTIALLAFDRAGIAAIVSRALPLTDCGWKFARTPKGSDSLPGNGPDTGRIRPQGSNLICFDWQFRA